MSKRLAIEVENIKWDTDGESIPDLPTTMAFEVDVDDNATDHEVNEAATEHMSDSTSFCVEKFSFKSVAEVEAPAPGL